MISDLHKRIADRRILEAQRKGRMDQLTSVVNGLIKSQDELKADAERHAKALDVLRTYSTMQEANVREKVESLVTEGLRAVFQRDDLTFLFKFELGPRGQMTATAMLQTKRGEHIVETEGTDSRGGGVLDVAAYLLKCVMLCLIRPPLDRIIIGDENFKHLSRNHLTNMGTMLKTMSDRLGIQAIMVTHKDEFIETADRVFDVSIKDGQTTIKQRSA